MGVAGLRFHWLWIDETDGTRAGNWTGDWNAKLMRILRTCARRTVDRALLHLITFTKYFVQDTMNVLPTYYYHPELRLPVTSSLIVI
jgi:hypothetical protein